MSFYSTCTRPVFPPFFFSVFLSGKREYALHQRHLHVEKSSSPQQWTDKIKMMEEVLFLSTKWKKDLVCLMSNFLEFWTKQKWPNRKHQQQRNKKIYIWFTAPPYWRLLKQTYRQKGDQKSPLNSLYAGSSSCVMNQSEDRCSDRVLWLNVIIQKGQTVTFFQKNKDQSLIVYFSTEHISDLSSKLAVH